jgi:hypothetical protein
MPPAVGRAPRPSQRAGKLAEVFVGTLLVIFDWPFILDCCRAFQSWRGGLDEMRNRFFADAAEAERLRKYADQMDAIGKSAVAAIWRDLASRVENASAPPAKRPTRIWFDARNARQGIASRASSRPKP